VPIWHELKLLVNFPACNSDLHFGRYFVAEL